MLLNTLNNKHFFIMCTELTVVERIIADDGLSVLKGVLHITLHT